MDTKITTQEIRTRVDSFLAELSDLVNRSALEAVQAALGEGGAPKRRGRALGSARRGPGRPRKAMRRARRAVARTGKRIRRSAEDLETIAAQVLTYVKSNAGHRLEQIGKALQVDTGILKRPVANLLASKKLSTKGKKRGTMYFAGGSRSASKSPRKAKTQRRRKAKSARKAKSIRRAPRKKAARRAKRVVVRAVRNRRAKPSRKASRVTRPRRSRAVADALALQAAVVPGATL